MPCMTRIHPLEEKNRDDADIVKQFSENLRMLRLSLLSKDGASIDLDYFLIEDDLRRIYNGIRDDKDIKEGYKKTLKIS